ncbi:sensor histidine kinase [Shouchella lonarensis]|uniref:Oxygen sensor histidine kinase NreB n=1 Tax=Shouchella lonarensis TaxID=1464122 RepID=A0A1G6H1C4_9BACI|nr:sensor histidine kinase [Shouchella lonarensis]SDB87954.1 two-component system, NarL family, sensor histidine kinase DegS [Shouchella lonarensis]
MKANEAMCDKIMEQVRDDVQGAQEKIKTMDACAREEYHAIVQAKSCAQDAIAASHDEEISCEDQSVDAFMRRQENDKDMDMEGRLLVLQQTMMKTTRYSEQLTRAGDALAGVEQHSSDRAIQARAVAVREEERLRLARDMHDGPAQLMTQVMLHTDYIPFVYEKEGLHAALDELHMLREYVRALSEDVRRVVADLRPADMSDKGIVETLRVYIEGIEEQMVKGSIVFESMGEAEGLSLDMQIALFRLVQESLHNVKKHAEADKVTVTLEMKAHEIVLQVVDNGKGFDPTQRKATSFGLVGMKERVDALGGVIDIDSGIGHGTSVTIFVPRDCSQTLEEA